MKNANELRNEVKDIERKLSRKQELLAKRRAELEEAKAAYLKAEADYQKAIEAETRALRAEDKLAKELEQVKKELEKAETGKEENSVEETLEELKKLADEKKYADYREIEAGIEMSFNVEGKRVSQIEKEITDFLYKVKYPEYKWMNEKYLSEDQMKTGCRNECYGAVERLVEKTASVLGELKTITLSNCEYFYTRGIATGKNGKKVSFNSSSAGGNVWGQARHFRCRVKEVK